MSTLYLIEQGSSLRHESQRLVVEKDGERLLEVPEFKVDAVLIFGNITVTTPGGTDTTLSGGLASTPTPDANRSRGLMLINP